jgi:predicted nucleic acid-binding protein
VVKALFDTNILIDYLNGVKAAKTELALHDDKAISIISWMEVQIGADAGNQAVIDQFLLKFTILPIDMAISAKAVLLRQKNRIKLPDAIIWATAEVENRILVTRNGKDFPAKHPGVRIPYSI